MGRNGKGLLRGNLAFIIVVVILAYVMYKGREFFGLKNEPKENT
jgi:TM2 domain-containing membrane protein YozV